MIALKAIFSGDASQLKKELTTIEKYAEHASEKISHAFGHKLLEFASVAGIEETIRRTIEYADKVSTLSQRLGISTDAVQSWDYALKLSNSSVDAAAGFFEKLATNRKKALEGDTGIINSFQTLGVTLKDLNSLRLEDLGTKIADAFKTGDPQRLIADLREVGGRGAGELVAAFREGLADSVKEAQDAGVIISESVLDTLRQAADTVKTLWMQFVANIAPAIAWLTVKMKEIYRGWVTIARAAGAFSVRGRKEDVRRAIQDYAKEIDAEDKAAEERLARRKQPLVGGDERTDKGAAQQAKKEEELSDRLEKLKEQNYLKSLNREERIAELKDQKARAEEIAATPFLTTEDKLRAKITAEEYGSKIADEENQIKQKFDRGKLTELQKVGAFAPAVQLIDVNKKMHHELKAIRSNLEKQGSFTAPAGRVRF